MPLDCLHGALAFAIHFTESLRESLCYQNSPPNRFPQPFVYFCDFRRVIWTPVLMDTRLLAQRPGLKAAVYVPCPAPNLFLAPVVREFQAVYHPVRLLPKTSGAFLD